MKCLCPNVVGLCSVLYCDSAALKVQLKIMFGLNVPVLVTTNMAGKNLKFSLKSSILTDVETQSWTAVIGLAAFSPVAPLRLLLVVMGHKRIMWTWCNTYCRNVSVVWQISVNQTIFSLFGRTIMCLQSHRWEGASSFLWLSLLHNLTSVRFTGQQHLILVTAVSQASATANMWII